LKTTFTEYVSKAGFLAAGFFLSMIGTVELYAQHPFSQAYESYLRGELTASEAIDIQIDALTHNHSHDGTEFAKCITPLFILMHQESGNIDEAVLRKMNSVASATNSSSNEYVSPSGKFRIHYETTGVDQVPLADANTNSIPDYIEEVANAADSSYRHEVITLGFTDPISDGDTYDIFVEDLSNFGAYGLANNTTSGQFPCNDLNSGTCIYIENDFAGYPPNTDPDGDALGAVRVTMAHEFKHAIQYAQSNWQGESDNWLEMDATLMEEVVYDNVNDYYNYIEGFSTDLFARATSSLIPGSYEDITWALYFHEKFGPTFWTEVWDFIEANNALTFLSAVEQALQDRNESYSGIVLESYMWHFASGPQFSGTNFGFDERMVYPGPNLSATYLEPLPALTNEFSLNRTSSRYYSIEPIESLDGFVALNFSASSQDIQFGLIGYEDSGNIITRKITDPTPDQLTSIDTDWQWSGLDRVGLVVTNTSISNQGSFRFQVFERIPSATEPEIEFINTRVAFNSTFRLYAPSAQNITIEVYDILGRHVQTVFNGPVDSGFRDFNFNTSSLASGIYLYRLISDSGTQAFTFPVIK